MNIPVLHVEVDIHVLLMKIFEYRVLRIAEPTAVQGCARKNTEYTSR